jgi:hypothetical protein
MMTPVELNQKGFQALVEALGYADAIRFSVKLLRSCFALTIFVVD